MSTQTPYSFIHDRTAGIACFLKGDRPFGYAINVARMLPDGADADACLRFVCATMGARAIEAPGDDHEAVLTDHLRRLNHAGIAAGLIKAESDLLPIFGPWIESGQILALAVGLREVERHHHLQAGYGASHFAWVLEDMAIEGVSPRLREQEDLELCIDRALSTEPYESMPRTATDSAAANDGVADRDRERIEALNEWLGSRGVGGVGAIIGALTYARNEDAAFLGRYFEGVGGADAPDPFAGAEATFRSAQAFADETALDEFGDLSELPSPSAPLGPPAQ